MPYVLELLRYWRDWPPTHMLTRWHVGYKPPIQPEDEAAMTGEQSGAVSFDKLPAAIQVSIMRSHGCQTYQEYQAYCERVKSGKVN